MALTDTIKKYRTTGRGRLSFAAIVIIAAVGAVAAGRGFGDGSPRVPWHRGRAGADSIERVRQALERGSPWFDLVKVSDEQRKQLLEIVERHEAGLRQLESDRGRLAEEFASALKANVLTPNEVEHLRTEAREFVGQAIDVGVALATETAQVLTPEQRARLAALWLAR